MDGAEKTPSVPVLEFTRRDRARRRKGFIWAVVITIIVTGQMVYLVQQPEFWGRSAAAKERSEQTHLEREILEVLEEVQRKSGFLDYDPKQFFIRIYAKKIDHLLTRLSLAKPEMPHHAQLRDALETLKWELSIPDKREEAVAELQSLLSR